ncbi:MAG TPA: type IV toxin-antitoxin system AbiEi family antitoxin domain-containing protein [Acidimicrobiales bacterium]|nr:type IV toxin-antitoxin system AbiEi family antitoxin domain-containing protein [Acidimicrobiales bacterium]
MDLDELIDRTAHAHHGLVSRATLLRAGASASAIDRRLRAGRLVRVAPGLMRLRSAPLTVESVALAGVLASGPTAVASHRTAAHLLGLDGCGPPEGRPEVTVVRPAHGSSRLAVAHQTVELRRGDRTDVRGVPVTRVERTLIDLAGVLPPPALESVLDASLRDGRTSSHRIQDRLRRDGQGRRGSALLAELLGIGPRPESWLERRIREMLRDAGVPAPDLQHVVRGDDGTIRRIDLSWFAGGVLVEVSGHATHSTRRERQRDRHRANLAVLEGRTLLEFTYEDVTERPHHVVGLITRALELHLTGRAPAA